MWYPRRGLPLSPRSRPASRFLVNGFSSSQSSGMSSATSLRSLVLTALQQSPRIRTIQDQECGSSSPRALSPGSRLPVKGAVLGKLAAQLLGSASFWVEGDVNHSDGRYSLSARVVAASTSSVLSMGSWR